MGLELDKNSDDDRTPRSALGELIRHRRRELACTQRDIALQLGVQQQTIARWELGAAPHRRFWPSLATFLGLTDTEFAEAIQPQASPHSTTARTKLSREGLLDSQERFLDAVASRMSGGEPLSEAEAALIERVLDLFDGQPRRRVSRQHSQDRGDG